MVAALGDLGGALGAALLVAAGAVATLTQAKRSTLLNHGSLAREARLWQDDAAAPNTRRQRGEDFKFRLRPERHECHGRT